MRSVILALALVLAADDAFSQPSGPGRAQYDQFCARCHGGDGRGGQMGPGIVARLGARSDPDLAVLVREGLPARGMPGVAIAGPDLQQLLAFLRTLRSPEADALPRVRVETVDGATLDGVALNQSSADLQLLTDDGRLHLMRPSGARHREVTSDVDWRTALAVPDQRVVEGLADDVRLRRPSVRRGGRRVVDPRLRAGRLVTSRGTSRG